MRKTEPGRGGSCKTASSIPAYLQNELTETERSAFETHLAVCASCRKEAEEVRTLMSELVAGSPDVPSRDLAPDILDRVREKETQGRGRLVLFPVLARVAALFLLAGGLALFLSLRAGHRSPCAVAAQPPAPPDAPADGTTPRQFVAAALDWLDRSQESTGSWDAAKWGAQKNYTPGISGLAVLAFLRQDPESLNGPHAQAIRAGLTYLLTQQNAEGRFGRLCSGTPYNQGIATLALLEACEQERNPQWSAAAERAVRYIQSTQLESGGWGYPRTPGDSGNTSVTVWQIQPLIKAAEAGPVADLDESIGRGLAWLNAMVDEDGRIGYSRAKDFPNGYEALTAAGALCLLTSPRQSARPPHLERILCALHGAAEAPGAVDYYRAYFITCALRISGGDRAEDLVGEWQDALIACQTPDGGCEPRDRWSSAGGRVYATAMAVLAM